MKQKHLGEEKESIYRNLCLQGNYQLVEGAVEFFAELKQQEIPFAIALQLSQTQRGFLFCNASAFSIGLTAEILFITMEVLLVSLLQIFT